MKRRETQSGQALVEFAIVAPVIVVMVLFAGWFYEFIQIKLKAQEAARYVAYEFTAYDLHDYGSSSAGSADSKFTTAKTEILREAQARFSDLDSTTKTGGLTHHFNASWTVQPLRATNAPTPMVPGNALVNALAGIATSLVNALVSNGYSNENVIAQAMIRSSGGGWGLPSTLNSSLDTWGFNSKGYIQASVDVRVHNGVGNIRIPDWMIGLPTWDSSQKVIARNDWNIEPETTALIVDPWNLPDGSDVHGSPMEPGTSTSKAFWKQVDKVAWLNPQAKAVATAISTAVRTQSAALVGLSLQQPLQADPMKTTLVSRPYGGGELATTGKISLQEDDGSKDYDTAPDIHGQAGKGHEYDQTRRKRGLYFMGCRQAEQLGCTDTLGQSNPFGDYIYRGNGE